MIIRKDKLDEIRKIDLLSWMRANEPNNLVHVSGETYCTKEHDSLRISNGKWFWFSAGFGGYSALDYLIKVKGMKFKDAVNSIEHLHEQNEYKLAKATQLGRSPKKEMELPECVFPPSRVSKYLKSRGISDQVIEYCLKHRLVMETKEHANALFVGYDETGKPQYACLRGTQGSGFKGELVGSNKQYGFLITKNVQTEMIHLFESAIDCLSYLTMYFDEFESGNLGSLLSLGGVSNKQKPGSIPAALERYLQTHPKTKYIQIHFDEDPVGQGAAKHICEELKGKYMVYGFYPVGVKDVNDALVTGVQGYHSLGKEVML